MECQCPCGHPIKRLTDALGCIECGRACCPFWAVALESVAYCRNCASALLDTPWALVAHQGHQHHQGVVALF